ncbi:hypothetical protein ACB264_02910 [Klebsiella pneumoniae]
MVSAICFNGHGFSGEDHIAFVFNGAFIIKHHHAAAFAQGVQSVFHTFKSGTERRKERLIRLG